MALAVLQAMLAGSFLGGQYEALMLHAVGAKATTALSAAQIVILVFLRRAGGPRSLIPIGVLVTMLLVGEFALGELRFTALHIPLGALLVAGILQLTVTVWRMPLPARVASDFARAPS
jgi:hypothetical protein